MLNNVVVVTDDQAGDMMVLRQDCWVFHTEGE